MGIGRLFTSQLAAPLRVWPPGSGEGLVAAAYAKRGSWVRPWPSWARGSRSRALPWIPPSPAPALPHPRHFHPSGIAPAPGPTQPEQPELLHPSAATGWEMLPLPPGNPPQNHTAHPQLLISAGTGQGQRVGLGTSTGWALLRPEMKLRWEEVGSKH